MIRPKSIRVLRLGGKLYAQLRTPSGLCSRWLLLDTRTRQQWLRLVDLSHCLVSEPRQKLCRFQLLRSSPTGTILFPEETSTPSTYSLCAIAPKPTLRLEMPTTNPVGSGATRPCPSMDDLNTPLLLPSQRSTEELWGLPTPACDTPPLVPSCGLFDSPAPPCPNTAITTDTDLMSKHLTTAPTRGGSQGETRSLNLAALDPAELESLLEDLAQPRTAPGPVQDNHSIDHDHDYVSPEEDKEDMAIFSEFMELTKPCLQTEEAAQLDSSFLETAVDLGPLLLGNFELPEATEEPQLLASFQLPAPASPAVSEQSSVVSAQDSKYRQRRDKNNRASRASRATRKEKRIALLAERRRLESEQADLNASVARLEALRDEWKAKLLALIG